MDDDSEAEDEVGPVAEVDAQPVTLPPTCSRSGSHSRSRSRSHSRGATGWGRGKNEDAERGRGLDTHARLSVAFLGQGWPPGLMPLGQQTDMGAPQPRAGMASYQHTLAWQQAGQSELRPQLPNLPPFSLCATPRSLHGFQRNGFQPGDVVAGLDGAGDHAHAGDTVGSDAAGYQSEDPTALEQEDMQCMHGMDDGSHSQEWYDTQAPAWGNADAAAQQQDEAQEDINSADLDDNPLICVHDMQASRFVCSNSILPHCNVRPLEFDSAAGSIRSNRSLLGPAAPPPTCFPDAWVPQALGQGMADMDATPYVAPPIPGLVPSRPWPFHAGGQPQRYNVFTPRAAEPLQAGTEAAGTDPRASAVPHVLHDEPVGVPQDGVAAEYVLQLLQSLPTGCVTGPYRSRVLQEVERITALPCGQPHGW